MLVFVSFAKLFSVTPTTSLNSSLVFSSVSRWFSIESRNFPVVSFNRLVVSTIFSPIVSTVLLMSASDCSVDFLKPTVNFIKLSSMIGNACFALSATWSKDFRWWFKSCNCKSSFCKIPPSPSETSVKLCERVWISLNADWILVTLFKATSKLSVKVSTCDLYLSCHVNNSPTARFNSLKFSPNCSVILLLKSRIAFSKASINALELFSARIRAKSSNFCVKLSKLDVSVLLSNSLRCLLLISISFNESRISERNFPDCVVTDASPSPAKLDFMLSSKVVCFLNSTGNSSIACFNSCNNTSGLLFSFLDKTLWMSASKLMIFSSLSFSTISSTAKFCAIRTIIDAPIPIKLAINLTFKPSNSFGILFWMSFKSKPIKPIEIPQKLKNIPTVAKIAGDCLAKCLTLWFADLLAVPNKAKDVKATITMAAILLVSLPKMALKICWISMNYSVFLGGLYKY